MTYNTIRHRLLEGVLLRLANLPEAGGVVLRGGMLLRNWFWPIPRAVLDLDLVAHAPLTLTDAMRFRPMFADTISDGVVFDTQTLAVEGIWLQTNHPGIRMHIRGIYNKREADVQVDITGGPPPRPAPVLSEFPTSSGTVRLWTCRPESILGQKLQALWHLGMLGWRPKDLDDLRLLLDRVPMDRTAIREAVRCAFSELGGSGSEARSVFASGSWWSMKHASARWSDFVAETGRVGVGDLSLVVSNVAKRLKPILEDVP